MSKVDLMRVDPILIAITFLEQKFGMEYAASLLQKAAPYNSYAKNAYNNISQGNWYQAQVDLGYYAEATYPVNNEDVSNNWLMKLQGCTNNIKDNALVIGAVFGTTAFIGGWQAGVAATLGVSAALCFSSSFGSYQSGNIGSDNTMDPYQGNVSFGETYKGGSIIGAYNQYGGWGEY